MQQNPNYEFIFSEIYDYLEEGFNELLSADAYGSQIEG